ncbi:MULTISPECIES: class I SAM-dependent methyltransferase [Staphylococcus]|uniref:class I SAM-dependent methyltransferase n=1 Tax=Staphylococcus TaxID=1279 RepID=UPI0007D98EE9|nr:MULTISPECIES: class I SAM-dependent methyltransferase [Staphylococcus]MCQ9294153.1 class I SAM-dependent methyltransferase [Staphylococcus cohnii]SCS21261.1 SAM-dependent methyltransferase [Staphylococcus cohnii subsp. cohnii]MDQ7111457.1 class I SAM-dependent methyltransferase [Staphylococcus ureilyticus]MDU9348377.1 class I SAM-dependent methyltransferase [Staphylococcus ureilyticus]OAO21691.1 SAM-dependent methyltransferase [Staphylococcus cohnii]
MNKNKIINYWNKRATSFSKDKQAELKSVHAERWLSEINQIKTIEPGMKILDIGTGAGFLAILCQQQGAQVTGIDLSPEMIQSAKQNALRFNINVNFQVMDAEHLHFDDAYFDLVISRNVTWLLPDTKAAYQEWLRVLKPNATLINIDGDYGNDAFTDYSDIPNHHAHHTLGDTMLAESENIKQSISINHYDRPQYDLNILKQINTKPIHVDTTIHKRIYQSHDEFYNPTPIFLIALTK